MRFLKWAAAICFAIAFIESVSSIIHLDMDLIALGLLCWVGSELS